VEIVSNNGPPCQSAEYEEFLRLNCIERILCIIHPHIIVSPNHLAERFGNFFKHSLESSASDPASLLQQRVQNFLLSWRSTIHATTGSSPAKLFLQRELYTYFFPVRPDLTTHVSLLYVSHTFCTAPSVPAGLPCHDTSCTFWASVLHSLTKCCSVSVEAPQNLP